MDEEEIGIEHYEKGDFGFYLPNTWKHVEGEEEEGYVERFDCEGIGRLAVECLPLVTEDEELSDPTLILDAREPGPDEEVGPMISLASGFVMRSYVHGDEDVPDFRWLNCELAWCFEPGIFGTIRFSGCVSKERLSDPMVVIHAHLIRACARRTEIVEDED